MTDKVAQSKEIIDTEVADIVHKNTKTMIGLRKQEENQRGFHQRVAAFIARYAGSMAFVYFQSVFIALWVAANLSCFSEIHAFDPYPFPLLALILTTEAIFLAVFILVSQNRMADLEKKREELNLQINLLTEHEVTRLIGIIESIATNLNIRPDRDLTDLKKETSPEKVLNVIEHEMDNLEKKPPKK